MKLIAAAALSTALVLTLGTAQAQQGAARQPAATAKKPAANTTRKPAAQPQRRQPARNAATQRRNPPARAAGAAAGGAAAAAVVAAPSLSAAELAIAQHVLTGEIPCELGQNVTVTPDEANPGYFHISAGRQRYHMRPVETTTGALRMEDTRAGAMWLQLGNKSMLLNQKQGQRIADECAAPAQRQMAEHLRANPQPGLLDAPR